MTPGRLNLMRLGSIRVLVDYAHNPAAVEGLMELAAQIPARRRIGVVTAPGDRRDEDIRAVGRLSAGLDRVLVKEDDDRRGRAEGEVAGLIIDGLREGGMHGDQLEVVPGEAEAVERAIREAGEGDLVVVLADHVSEVLALVQRHTDGAGAV